MLILHNIILLQYRVVKLSSPNLNYVIIAGAALLYSSMYFYSTSVSKFSQKLEKTILCNVSYYHGRYNHMN